MSADSQSTPRIGLPFQAHDFHEPPITRFAPSPNGRLHLGHALSAMLAKKVARLSPAGQYLVRMEDIDGTRSTPENIESILQDLEWLGLAGDAPVLFQSSRIAAYDRALEVLQQRHLVYRCFCSRSEIKAALSQKPVLHGPDGPAYPGTCRHLSTNESARRSASLAPYCWRLKMDEAYALASKSSWQEAGEGRAEMPLFPFGDIVIWRKDAPASYHLAVVLDDAMQCITPIVRGRDLYAYTGLHRLLQSLLDLPEPVYWHHPLLMGADGEKLAKSAASTPLAHYRAAGISGKELLDMIDFGQLPLGISVAVA